MKESKITSPTNFFDILPLEIRFAIKTFLLNSKTPFQDLSTLGRVNNSFYQETRDEKLWQEIYRFYFPRKYKKQIDLKNVNWRKSFFDEYRNLEISIKDSNSQSREPYKIDLKIERKVRQLVFFLQMGLGDLATQLLKNDPTLAFLFDIKYITEIQLDNQPLPIDDLFIFSGISSILNIYQRKMQAIIALPYQIKCLTGLNMNHLLDQLEIPKQQKIGSFEFDRELIPYLFFSLTPPEEVDIFDFLMGAIYFGNLQRIKSYLEKIKPEEYEDRKKYINQKLFKAYADIIESHHLFSDTLKKCFLLIFEKFKGVIDLKFVSYTVGNVNFLISACMAGDHEFVKSLIKLGFDVNQCSKDESTAYKCALTAASYSGNLELVKTLLEVGKANLFLPIKNDEGKFFLVHECIVKMRIEEGENISDEMLSFIKSVVDEKSKEIVSIPENIVIPK